ncbi:MAG: hypothetical protein GXY29_12820 [Thermotogaceae bacterium]|nr:hypothetical protein [Thermotogaceae bacterium]
MYGNDEDGYDYFDPESVRNASVYIKRDKLPTLTDYDSRSGEFSSYYHGGTLVGQKGIEPIWQPEPGSLYYIMIYGEETYGDIVLYCGMD